MAELSTSSISGLGRERSKVLDILDRFFTGMGQGFNAYMERRSRSGEIERLHKMTDEELAELGITRDRIAYYVFADMFYV